MHHEVCLMHIEGTLNVHSTPLQKYLKCTLSSTSRSIFNVLLMYITNYIKRTCRMHIRIFRSMFDAHYKVLSIYIWCHYKSTLNVHHKVHCFFRNVHHGVSWMYFKCTLRSTFRWSVECTSDCFRCMSNAHYKVLKMYI